VEVRQRIEVCGPSGTEPADLLIVPDPPTRLRVVLANGRVLEAEGPDLFGCLMEVRRHLEADGLLICCQGARRDVHPSGMARQMVSGRMAYRLPLDGQPGSDDLVDIFAPAMCDEVVTVADQLAWVRTRHERWVAARAPRELLAEAQKVPGGWVYEIEQQYASSERIPHEAIRGAWRVTEARGLDGYFPNPGYGGSHAVRWVSTLHDRHLGWHPPEH
jgi:hypothetical protein